MTLSKQIIIIFVVGIFLLFVGTFTVTVNEVKGYYENQLNQDAQNTASALGLTLTKQFNAQLDKATILSKVRALFDRGSYSKIEIKDINGNPIVSRYIKNASPNVPMWFENFISIQNQAQKALIMNGWNQVGQVSVKSNENTAIQSLWATTKKLFALFLVLTLFITIIGASFIYMAFRPLKKIIKQADDIGNKEFYTLDKKPRTKELRRLSDSINNMVEKLKAMFSKQMEEAEQLRNKAYMDGVTDLGNRRYFLEQLEQYLESEEMFSPGYLLLIELTGLAAYNEENGYLSGNVIIGNTANIIQATLDQENVHLIARIGGLTFACVVIESNSSNIQIIADDLYKKIQKMLETNDPKLTIAIGIARSRYQEAPSTLLH
jgi:diguanylate cyclase (GGDEF)-like protein